MAQRVRYLLVYDIRDPKRLRRVHAVAKDFGEALQYSVFVCDLSKIELLAMKRHLVEEADLSCDSIGIFDLGQPDGRGVRCVELLGSRRGLPDQNKAAVW